MPRVTALSLRGKTGSGAHHRPQCRVGRAAGVRPVPDRPRLAPADVQEQQRRAEHSYPCKPAAACCRLTASRRKSCPDRLCLGVRVAWSAGRPSARSRCAPAHRWLANAEADRGGAIRPRRAPAHQLGAGAAAAGESTLADRDAGAGARPGKDGDRAGGGGHVLRRSLRSLRSVIRRQDRPPPTVGPRSAARPARPRGRPGSSCRPRPRAAARAS